VRGVFAEGLQRAIGRNWWIEDQTSIARVVSLEWARAYPVFQGISEFAQVFSPSQLASSQLLIKIGNRSDTVDAGTCQRIQPTFTRRTLMHRFATLDGPNSLERCYLRRAIRRLKWLAKFRHLHVSERLPDLASTLRIAELEREHTASNALKRNARPIQEYNPRIDGLVSIPPISP